MRQAYITRGSTQIESWALYPSLTVVNESVAVADASDGSLFDASLGMVFEYRRPGSSAANSWETVPGAVALPSFASFEYRNRGSTQATTWNSDGLPDDGVRAVVAAESVLISDTQSVSGVWAGTVAESVAIFDSRSSLTTLSGAVAESVAALDAAAGTRNVATNFAVVVVENVSAAAYEVASAVTAVYVPGANVGRRPPQGTSRGKSCH